MYCISKATFALFVYTFFALCISCSAIAAGDALDSRSGISKRAGLSAPVQSMLNMYAAYAGAAYYDMNDWTCSPECQVPETSGTVIDYKWDMNMVTSNGYIAHNPNKRIIVVADLALQHPELQRRIRMYTYGQAKCGNEVFADFMNRSNIPIARVVNKGDIAPHLPSNNPTLVQFGTEIWYTLTNDTIVCPSGDYSRCSDSLPQSALNTGDHSTYPGL